MMSSSRLDLSDLCSSPLWPTPSPAALAATGHSGRSAVGSGGIDRLDHNQAVGSYSQGGGGQVNLQSDSGDHRQAGRSKATAAAPILRKFRPLTAMK